MTDDTPSPAEATGTLATFAALGKRYWRDFKGVYYANTPIWRVLKSGALLALGLFCWSGANLLLSVNPGWGFLWYVVSYGFVLLFWGPFTHFVVVPFVIRTRRSGAGPLARVVSQHGSKINLTTFVLVVVLLGTFPIGPMTLDFTAGGEEDRTYVDPHVECTATDEVVHCSLSDTEGIDHVVVLTGGTEIERVDGTPFEFEFKRAELGERQRFTIEVRDEDGNTLRRYVRTADTLPAPQRLTWPVPGGVALAGSVGIGRHGRATVA